MVCPSMRPLVDMLRDCLEQEFARLVPASVLLERAGTWRTTLESQGRPLGRPDPVDARRWPILTAWRFLVPMPDREPVLSADVNGSSKAAVAAEMASDLGYRAILPFALGQAVCRLAASTTTNSFAGERFAVVHNPGDVQQEAVQETARKKQMAPAITVTTLLLLGLRRVRIEYAKRTSFWRACASSFFEETPVDVGPSRGLPAPSTLQGWLASAAGQSCVKEWRWLVPTPSVLESRLRREPTGVRSLTCQHMAEIQAHGVPLMIDGSPSWGPAQLLWQDARLVLNTRCACVATSPLPALMVCDGCGCARLSPACASADALSCPWCRQRHGAVCRMCSRLLHFRGECAWNRGAHGVYNTSPHEIVLLCPDCSWQWVQLLQACPSRPSVFPPTGELARHLGMLEAATEPGAGDAVARPKASVSWGKVRRWLLRLLRHASFTKEDAFVHCQEHFHDADPGVLRPVFEQVLGVVCREGLLAVTRRAGALVFSLPC